MSTKSTDVKQLAPPPLKIPVKLSAVADLAYELRAERLAIGRVAAEYLKQETQLKEHLINNLAKGDASAIAGKVATAKVVVEPIPVVKDEAKLWAAIKRNKAKYGALVAKPAIDSSVLKQMFEDGVSIPGVEAFNVVKVSLTKV